MHVNSLSLIWDPAKHAHDIPHTILNSEGNENIMQRESKQQGKSCLGKSEHARSNAFVTLLKGENKKPKQI